jgi:hypothetical protein
MVPCQDVPLHIKPAKKLHRSEHHSGRRIGLVEEVSELNYSFDSILCDGTLHRVGDVSNQPPATAIETPLHRTPKLGVVPDVKISEHTYLH